MAKAAKTHMKRLDEEYEKAVATRRRWRLRRISTRRPSRGGQQAFERGKIAHAAAKAGENAEANAKETDAMFTLAEEKFAESLEMLPESEKEAVNKSEPIDGESASLASQILILHGNVLFERSQVRHHREEKNWAEDCDAAVAKFNKAGCSKEDITRALMNHTSGTWKEEAEAEKEGGGVKRAKRGRGGRREPRVRPPSRGAPVGCYTSSSRVSFRQTYQSRLPLSALGPSPPRGTILSRGPRASGTLSPPPPPPRRPSLSSSFLFFSRRRRLSRGEVGDVEIVHLRSVRDLEPVFVREVEHADERHVHADILRRAREVILREPIQ